jgi:hypothetical protein
MLGDKKKNLQQVAVGSIFLTYHKASLSSSTVKETAATKQ